MITFLIRCQKLWKKYSKDEMSIYAAQASFFIIISAFPFIMLLFTVIQLIPNITINDLQLILTDLMPDMFDPLVIQITNDLYTKSPGTVLSITAITAVWSASKGMLSIERGLNRIHGCLEHRRYLFNRVICTLYTLIFALICVLALGLMVFGNSLQSLLNRLFPQLVLLLGPYFSLGNVITFLVMVMFFAGIYTFVPKERPKLREQIPGAIFAAIGWTGFSYGFSIYFMNFSNFSYMYGSLTAIVLLMLWLYVCICILFLGAELSDLHSREVL